MNASADFRPRRAQLLAAIAVTVTLGLAGCAPGMTETKTSTPPPSQAAVEAPTQQAAPMPTATPTPTPTVAIPPGTPTKIACSALLSAQAVYDFNPNFGLDKNFTPKSASAAATAVAARGTACNWLNQTSGEVITISVARPAAAHLAALKAGAATGTSTAGLGDAAYFSTSAGKGRMDVFRGPYWLVVTSGYFASARDASVIVTTAMGALN